MRQALVCVPNETTAKATVVCSGDMIITKTRENINQVKLKLLDRMDKDDVSTQQHRQSKYMNPQFSSQLISVDDSAMYQTGLESEESKASKSAKNEINYDYSSKTNIMLVSLTDFCPYFCSTEDLNGKQLKDLKKREIMSPFNVHFNVTNMIELVRGQVQPMDQIQKLVFRKFKKTEISLDWTLLKLSFHDLQIFKQIAAHNVALIKQRSETMADAAEEGLSCLQDLSRGDHSSEESGSSTDE